MSDRNIGQVVELWRYPVSSAAGERCDHLAVHDGRIEGDRLYGLFEAETGKIIFPSRKRLSNAAPFVCARIDERGTLLLSTDGSRWFAPDDPVLVCELEQMFEKPVSVLPYGTTFNGITLAPRYEHSPVHLLSRQSLRLLQSALPESQIDPRRFRPNILVDFPDSEDGCVPELALRGETFRIGNITLRGTEDCGRCSFTTLAQTGLEEDRDILRQITSQFGRNFGIYCDIVSAGEIAIADRLSARADLNLAVRPEPFPVPVSTPSLANAPTVDQQTEVARRIIRLGPVSIVAEGQLLAVELDNVGSIVLTRRGDRFFALANLCPHAEAALSEGFIDGHHIVCPLHLAGFDMTNGRVKGGPHGCPDTRAFRVAVEGDDLVLHTNP